MACPSQNNKPRLSPHEYTVGWISALPIEHAAAAEMLDEEHETPTLQDNDPTLYTLGKIYDHNVVISCLPAGLIGNVSAATIATRLANRFPNAKIGLMVGIGGGVPSDEDIRLGDVVVSQPGHGHGGVVQYDMGKRLPDGKFEKTGHLDKPPTVLLNALAQVRSNHARELSTFDTNLSKLQGKAKFDRQRAGPDRLFRSAYRHEGPSCAGCKKEELVPRDSRHEDELVKFHYGTIASANSLIKDGTERDRICQDFGGNILCFEMEAAGLMNNFPCLVIRGICDYADSHNNKEWQPYAAATAAAYAKEILSVIPPNEVARLAPIKAPWVLPFNRNPQFTGRGDILLNLHQCLQEPERHPYIAIHGLGGSGKSAVAIEFAYQARDQNLTCAIFWVSSFTAERFQESYREIARALQIPSADDLEKDMLEPVRRKLTAEDRGKWLMIVDNVDDRNVLLHTKINNHQLYDYLPRSRGGMVLFTTRNRQTAIDLAPNENFPIGEMKPDDAKDLVRKSLKLPHEQALYSEDAVDRFLTLLTYLPLAIIQALAYMKKNDRSVGEYIELFQETRQSKSELLQKDFNDPTRANESLNAVTTTWLISFERIKKDDKLGIAIKYLSFLACIVPQNIPERILPSAPSKKDQEEAIGILTAYAFLAKSKENGLYNIHTLIHHVTQDWLKNANIWIETTTNAIKWLTQLVPPGGHEKSKQYSQYLAHGLFATEILEIANDEPTIKLLDRIGRCYQSLGEFSNAVLTHTKFYE
ncbi:hypothetical protein BP5796_12014 [Coleophoma crateriformis]|uniref:NB-ARC domain-containing protein n=1 Tax=Coleophoma crateriformis TaxID=565419 RepID=A0A3D8QBR1_9HELO|nr:hypothetical protein BP5796_12014 [Coleophoma crateriformis]